MAISWDNGRAQWWMMGMSGLHAAGLHYPLLHLGFISDILLPSHNVLGLDLSDLKTVWTRQNPDYDRFFKIIVAWFPMVKMPRYFISIRINNMTKSSSNRHIIHKFIWRGFAPEAQASVLLFSSLDLPWAIFLQHWYLQCHSVYRMLSVWIYNAQFFSTLVSLKTWSFLCMDSIYVK